MDLNHLKDAIKRQVKPIGSWAWNRLNLARDGRAVRTFDFVPSQVREVKELMRKYAVSRPEIRTRSAVPFALLVAYCSFFIGAYSNRYFGSFGLLFFVGLLPFLSTFQFGFDRPKSTAGLAF
jgi:hypothetical protein